MSANKRTNTVVLIILSWCGVHAQVEVVNSDESWRFDWKPGVRYLRGGVEVGINDDLFPCGGDTVFGLYTFPSNSTPPGRYVN